MDYNKKSIDWMFKNVKKLEWDELTQSEKNEVLARALEHEVSLFTYDLENGMCSHSDLDEYLLSYKEGIAHEDMFIYRKEDGKLDYCYHHKTELKNAENIQNDRLEELMKQANDFIPELDKLQSRLKYLSENDYWDNCDYSFVCREFFGLNPERYSEIFKEIGKIMDEYEKIETELNGW